MEELAVEQELKSKQFRVQRMETQEEAAKIEVTGLYLDFSVFLLFAIDAAVSISVTVILFSLSSIIFFFLIHCPLFLFLFYFFFLFYRF